jgi:HSP20 family molecular chaperone IbpA
MDKPHLMAFGRWLVPAAQYPGGRGPRPVVWEPPTDVYRLDDTLVIRIELAGVTPDDVELTVEGRYLRITGDRPRPECYGGPCEFRQAEISYGPFERIFEFPAPLDQAEMKAACRDGFLTIEVRAAHSQPRRIAIDPSPER